MGLDDGQTGIGKIAEVALVAVPPHQRRRVLQAFTDGVGPLQESVVVTRVVPGRADDDQVEAVPVNAVDVPRDDLRVGSAIAEQRKQDLVVGELARHRTEARDRDPHGRIVGGPPRVTTNSP